MPFQIIKGEIAKIKCDAIVNPTNENLEPSGGVDLSVHQAAGEELYKACQAIGGLKVGQAKITPAYGLPCKFVIHTVGPFWQGGAQNERTLLKSCYEEALKIAQGTKCESVAFPLISSGLYGYPKEEVLTVALEVIKEFLYKNESEMLVYIVVYDKSAYDLSKRLKEAVSAYISDNYEEFIEEEIAYQRIERAASLEEIELGGIPKACKLSEELEEDFFEDEYDDEEEDLPFPRSHWRKQSVPKFESVGSLKKFIYKGFRDTLLGFLDEKGITDVTCYKRAGVSRQTWHKIVSDANYSPTKRTAIALAISAELSIDETQELLASAGFILSKSSLFDVIIMFCIVKKIYDVFEIDAILFQYDQETLFSVK